MACGSPAAPACRRGTRICRAKSTSRTLRPSPPTPVQGLQPNLFGSETTANPYHYGHLPEVTVNPDGTGTIKKHYCLGRISHELVQVMPDKRTVLMGDDATNGGLFMFVADREADLSAGTLYVAEGGRRLSSSGAGAATLSWINLGHATSDEIESLANTLNAADIMDVKTADPLDTSYTKINFNGTFNWISVKPGMTKAATFLETHRYAALVGGSMGFTKLEGTTVNIKDKVLYSAMSRVEKSMVRGNAASTDRGGRQSHQRRRGLRAQYERRPDRPQRRRDQ